MPGIFGLITKAPPSWALSQLKTMMSVVRHEAFYSSGVYHDESHGAYVGWTARAGSFSDGMPLRSEEGDISLAFSGEAFFRMCGEAPHSAAGQAACLLDLYKSDPQWLTALNGRFHGLLLDQRSNRAFLFNDRYGMHRLYYHASKDAVYFAAEAKAILAVRPELRSIDLRGLGEFIACDAVLENRTIFKNIHVLPQGSLWSFCAGSLLNKSIYFQATEWEQQERLDAEDYYRALRSNFLQTLPRYFAPTQPIAMSLTGGLDTRMILACRPPAPGSLPCYTFGSMFRENHDVRVARNVANACKQPFEVLTVGREFLAHFPTYASRAVFLTDGTVDTSRAPDLYLNELARQIAPVRMTGVYGGEVLRGVRGFKPVPPMAGLYSQELAPYFKQAEETYYRISQCHPVTFAAFKQAPWYHHGILQLEQTQLTMRSPYLDNDFVRTVFRSPAEALSSNEISLRLIADGSRELRRIPTDRGVGGAGGAAQALRRAMLEFSFKAEYAYDMGMPQWLATADHALRRLHLERLFLGRHKVFHFRVWYRDALADYVRQTLLDSRSFSRGYIDRNGLRAIVEGHISGKANYTNEIHKVLGLELMHRHLVDGLETPRDSAVPAPGGDRCEARCHRA